MDWREIIRAAIVVIAFAFILWMIAAFCLVGIIHLTNLN